jgi:hypothetical protein
MMIQMVIHKRRPFFRSQAPEKAVRMLRASRGTTCREALEQSEQPLAL